MNSSSTMAPPSLSVRSVSSLASPKSSASIAVASFSVSNRALTHAIAFSAFSTSSRRQCPKNPPLSPVALISVCISVLLSPFLLRCTQLLPCRVSDKSRFFLFGSDLRAGPPFTCFFFINGSYFAPRGFQETFLSLFYVSRLKGKFFCTYHDSQYSCGDRQETTWSTSLG